MKSIGFGLERVALAALEWPRTAAIAFFLLLVVAAYGLTGLSFDEDLRDTFASNSEVFRAYRDVTDHFVDPENETLVLVEGDHLGDPATFQKLQDFQFELQLLDGVDNVFSLFALRHPPDANGNASLLVDDPSKGLTPDLIAAIRAHPLLGSKLVSADGKTMMYDVTPTVAKAPLSVPRALKAEIEKTADTVLAGTGARVTVSGFPIVRVGIIDILRRDQIVLNAAGAFVGFLMSLLVFRSLIAATIVAVPAVLGGLTVLGIMGLTGTPVTVMSTVIPALVMIFGYTDGMHLCFAWRRHRDAGLSVAEAERLAQREVAGAVLLAAITTAIAFLSLVISSVIIVRGFGIIGAFGTVGGGLVVLVAHGIITNAIGHRWRTHADTADSFLHKLERPCGAIGRFVVRFGKPISGAAFVLLVVLGAMHFSVPPQHSIREHLPANDPANAALGRMDKAFGGLFPIQIVVPLHGEAPNSPAALKRIGAIHEAVAGVDGVSAPLSIWSVVQWLGGGADAATAAKLAQFEQTVSPKTARRFYGTNGAALITANVEELPSYKTAELVNRLEKAVHAAGGKDVEVTGVTVINSREGARTISNLNLSLTLSVIANLGVIALAFRSAPIGLLSFLPNILPLLATGSFLFLTGRGMQFTSVIALTVAFGIAVDGTVHFLNRYLLAEDPHAPLNDRLAATTAHIGPVLVGTTLIIIAGMSTTLTSGMPTISTFGWIASLTLVVALFCDLVVLPGLIAGVARPWFEKHQSEIAAARAKETAA